MRGGAIPLFAWAGVLAVLMAINWIWTGDAIQVGTFAFAVLAVLSAAALLVALAPQALRRGAPQPRPEPETLPTASLGAVLCALAVAAIVFGLAFGRFLVYFGAGLLLSALARVAIEVAAERRARARWKEAQRG